MWINHELEILEKSLKETFKVLRKSFSITNISSLLKEI